MQQQKTVIIFDQCGEAPIEFYVLNGDYRHLHGVYINECGDEALTEQLLKLLYDFEGRKLQKKPRNSFPYHAVKAGAFVIVAGFMP